MTKNNESFATISVRILLKKMCGNWYRKWLTHYRTERQKIETEIIRIPKIVSHAGETSIAIYYTASILRKN